MNKDNCYIMIDGVKNELNYSYMFNKKGKYTIDIIEENTIKNMSFMFYGDNISEKIKEIKLSDDWDMKKIENLGFMFYGCKQIQSIIDALKNWKTDNVSNLSNCFSWCSNLQSIDALKNWKTDNVTDLSDCFYGCSYLQSIDALKNWKTDNERYLI